MASRSNGMKVVPEDVEPLSLPNPEPEAAPDEAKSEVTLRREAFTAAVGRLKEAHRDEFRALVQEEAGKRGVTYEFRKTDEEKAAEQVKDLLAKFPHLAETLQPQG